MRYEIINGNTKIINVLLDGKTEKGTEFTWNEIKYRVLEIVIKDPQELISLNCRDISPRKKGLMTKQRTTL